jgi:CDP-diacylglycerol--serine O-phosphatidyltransferase
MTLSASLHSLAAAQKTSRGVPAYTLHVNRPLGRVVAAVAHELRLTPNQVTTISGLLSLAGILVIALVDTSVGSGIAAAVLLALGYVFDSADGQLARLRGAGGPVGEWYDHVLDCAKTVALHAALLIATYRFVADPPAWHLLLPLAFQLVGVVLFFSTILAEQLLRGLGAPRAAASGSPLRSVLMLPVDFGVTCIVVALLGVPQVFWPAYGLLFVAACGFLLLYLVTSYRRLSGGRPARPEPVVAR